MTPNRTPHRPSSALRGQPDIPVPRNTGRRRSQLESSALPDPGLRAEMAASEPAVSGVPDPSVEWATDTPRSHRNRGIERLIGGLGLRQTMEQHPYALIGGAFSVGYVLGGGRIGTVLLRLGGELVHRELRRLTNAMLSGLHGG